MTADEIIQQLKDDNTLFNQLSPTPEWLVEEIMQRDLRIQELENENMVVKDAVERSSNTHEEDQIINIMKFTYIKEPDLTGNAKYSTWTEYNISIAEKMLSEIKKSCI